MSLKTVKPLLDAIDTPKDLRLLKTSQLKQLSDELRNETIEAVSTTGGHLGAGLGVVELTVALHYVFNTPLDKLIWDVGHQAYPHKILTGRRDRIRTLRQGKGLSGFTKRSESRFDPFGAAHAATSISASLGFAVARDLKGESNNIIAVIGDGSLTAGMAYEAMNNAGSMASRLVVILNDNDMSIAPPVGAMSAYLSRLISSRYYRSIRHLMRDLTKKFPKIIEIAANRSEEYARGLVTGGTLFEELGFFYVGPIDGHNLDHLLPVFKNVKNSEEPGPVLIHVVTKKGGGYPPAEASEDKYHGVGKFDVISGALATSPQGPPDRCFDVGIAEQHAVTFAAGLAADGLKPFAAIYSTFLQRGYDSVVHDVAIQGLPVRFALDRAGMVGADGVTHQGWFDITYLGCLPGFILMAAADEAELIHMVKTAVAIDDRPSAFRYPRGNGIGIELPEKAEVLQVGKGRVLLEGTKVALLSYGTRLYECLTAAKTLASRGLSTTVADARFAKPIDKDLLRRLASEHEVLVTIEDGAIGGFSSQVVQFLAHEGLLDSNLKFRPMCIPDFFIDHETQENQFKLAGLTASDIIKTALAALGHEASIEPLVV